MVNGNGTLTNPNLALYSGTCATLNQLSCAVNSIWGNTVTVYNSTLTVGNTYYIRVNGNGTGTFQLCINNFFPSSSNNQDCINATLLCNKDTISINGFNGPGVNQNEMGGSCMPAELQSSWYIWTATNNGILTFSITPNNQTDDIDFFVFQLPDGNCNNKTVIRCCVSSCLGPNGSTGLSLTEIDDSESPDCDFTKNGFVQFITMTAGSTYGILINNASGQGGYSLSFGGLGNFQGHATSLASQSNVACNGDSTGGAIVTVAGRTIPYSYSWNTFPVQDNAIASGLTAGPYVCTVTDANGCTSSQNVVINQPPAISVTRDSSAAICTSSNGSASVTVISGGVSPYTYSWNTFPVQNTSTASGLAAGNYLSSILDSNGCELITPVNVPASSGTLDVEIGMVIPVSCKGGNNGSASVTVSGGNDPYSYSWNPTGGVAATASGLIAGLYEVVVKDGNNCIDSATANITEPDSLLVTSEGTSICTGQNTAISAVPLGGTPPYTYIWNPGAITGSPISVSPSVSTVYTVMVTDSNNCTVTATNLINVLPAPVADFDMTPPQFAPLSNPVIQFIDQSTGADQRQWNFGDVFNSIDTLKDPSFTYSDTGSYKVTLLVTNNEGCTDTTNQTIYIESEYAFYIPNAFTPGNDDLNEFFGPKGTGLDNIENFEMAIYDRWGEEIYYTTDISKPWDGKLNGSEIREQEVYVYKIQLKALNKRANYYTGTVSLIR